MTTKQEKYIQVELNADLLTPITIFKKIKGRKKFLLESSFQHETKGKFSYIGANPYLEVLGYGNKTITINHLTGEEKKYDLSALNYLEKKMPVIETDIPLSFTGGAIGYVGYDTVKEFMHIGEALVNDLEMPDVHFMLYDTIIAYEHQTEKAHLIAMKIEEEDSLEQKINEIKAQLKQPVYIPEAAEEVLQFRPEMNEDDFLNIVRQAKEYIDRGEAKQIVLSQRMVAPLSVDSFSFYRHLRSKNPSPYMFYIDFEDYLITGSSPESLVQTNGRKVVTNPIAGTRPRGSTPEEDKALEEDLLTDQKEIAEHEMLVELSKEDLQAICQANSIEVPVNKRIVKYEHVMHLVSEVHGELRDSFTSFDALLACLPAGTVSGSPKQRAMQIINELEKVKRGVYAGGIGFISFNRDINLAITIRSLVIKEEKAYLQVGAGIVKDSKPELEFAETLQKARSLME